MPVSREDQLRIAQRRARVAEKHLRRIPQVTIAAQEGVDPSTVCRDLEVVYGEWLAEHKSKAGDAFDRYQTQELAQIDLIRQQAWEAWEWSKKDAQRLVSEETVGGKDGGKSREVTEIAGRVADATFLKVVGWCTEQRCKILSLYPATEMKIAATVQHVNSPNIVLANPRAADLACRLFDLIATEERVDLIAHSPGDASGAGVVCEPAAVEASQAPEPAEPQTD